MDKVHKQTDAIIADLERRIERLYANDPALLRLKQKYARYMGTVDDKTDKLRDEYLNAQNAAEKRKKKAAYDKVLLDLTQNSRQYNEIVREFTRELARVNQKALDLVNAELSKIYAINYNAVATDCRKAGIKVVEAGV